MPDLPQKLDHSFTAPIGVDVKGDLWPCVEVPGAAELLGTKRSVRVDAVVDQVALDNIGLMTTGNGGLMLSLSAKVQAKLGKGLGDHVAVQLLRRLT